MAVNSFNSYNALNPLNPSLNNSKLSQNHLFFSSKNNCFKKWSNECSNAFNENNNNNYFYCNHNRNDFKSDSKLFLIQCEQKLKSTQFKPNLIINNNNNNPNVESINTFVDISSDTNEEMNDEFSCEGMKAVPQWLKVLRLHKYANLFSSLTYEELLNTTEEELEKKNVTKGARNKIIVCIQRLRNRPKVLKSLENDVISRGFAAIGQTLIEIKSLLNTPFKAYNCVCDGSQPKPKSDSNTIENNSDSNLLLLIANHSNRDIVHRLANNSVNYCDINSCLDVCDEDLPEMFTRLLGLVYAVLIETSNIDDESYNLFNSALDKCLAHDAFSFSQKSRFNKWKQIIHKVWTSRCSYRRSVDGRLSRSKWNRTSFCNSLSNSNSNRVEMNYCNSSSHSEIGSVIIRKRFSSISSNVSLSTQKSLPGINEPLIDNGFEPHFSNVLSMNSQNHLRPRALLCRTHSAPVGKSHSSRTESHFHSSTYEFDQLNDTEKLCIRMTEQALGISDGGLLHHNIRHDL